MRLYDFTIRKLQVQVPYLIRGPELLDRHLGEQGLDQRHDHRRADEVRLDVQHAQRVVALDGGREQQGGPVGEVHVGQREHLQVGVGGERVEQLLEVLVGDVLRGWEWEAKLVLNCAKTLWVFRRNKQKVDGF